MSQDHIILLQQYCEINELPYHTSWNQVIKYQVSHPDHIIQYVTPYGRLFSLTHQVIAHKLDAHLFMTMGDIYNPIDIVHTNQSPYCIVIDHIIQAHYNHTIQNIIIIH